MKIIHWLILISLSMIVIPGLAQDGIQTGKALQSRAESHTRKVDSAALKKMIQNEPDLVLIDIRTSAEIKKMGGHIDAAQNVNIPRGWLEFRIQNLAPNRDTPIVAYCGAGIRSPLAAETLQNMGYTNVKNYAEGFLGWKQSGGAIGP